MSEGPTALSRLVHDVGKYLSRTARNLPPEGPIPDALGRMLEADLYATHAGRRASARFEELAAGIDAAVAAELRPLLAEIDRLEPAVRARETASVREAAALALRIDQRLRAAQKASSR